MSFEIDGRIWQPKSTSEHTENLLATINTLLQENNITDAAGNVIQLSANFANAFYLMCLASGNRYADNDEKLAAAINSFNIALCDDAQIENLLPIAAVERNPGSFSTLTLTAKAAPGATCEIPAGTRAPFGDVNFIVKSTVVIDNSTGTEPKAQQVETICDTIGPVIALTGEVASFDGFIAGLDSVTNEESSVPGVAAETTNELRARLIKGNTIKYTLEGCKSALETLNGIAYARVYFNYNNSTTVTLPGGVVVQPRTAYLVVYGANYDGLAEVYSEYMSAPTQNAPNAGSRGKTQNYITNSGQEIPVKFDEAGEKTVYVKIWLAADAEDSDEIEAQLKRDLLTASSKWGIGQDVTGLLTGQPFSAITYTKVAYCEVSEDGESWSQIVESGCNVIPRITDETIEVDYL